MGSCRPSCIFLVCTDSGREKIEDEEKGMVVWWPEDSPVWQWSYMAGVSQLAQRKREFKTDREGKMRGVRE